MRRQAVHAEPLLLGADYTEACAAVAATGGVSRGNGLSSCADAMPPLALILYALSLAGLLPMPHPHPHLESQQLQPQAAAPALSHVRVAGAAARGAGLGAVYGGGADAAGLGALGLEYGGATEHYYRTFGLPAGRTCRAVLAAPQRASGGWRSRRMAALRTWTP